LAVVKREDLSCFLKIRKFVRLSGVSPPIDIKPFNNCIDTLERAVNERVFYVKVDGKFVEPPRPDETHFTETMSSFGDSVVRGIRKTVPLNRQVFVNTFRGRKAAMYTRAMESLMENSLTPKDAEIQVFVKCEKTDFTSKRDPVPRVISPRSTRYNVEVGRYLRRIEESVFRSIGDVFGHRTVIKGCDAVQSARLLHQKWSMFTNPVAVGLDASRFDQHVSQPALEFEHSVYTRCFAHARHRRHLKYLLNMQKENICRGYTPDGKLKYKTNGGRMSGDMNTSLGNCLIMCGMIHAYLSERGIRGQLANNGDDCVVFMEQRDLEKFQNGLKPWFVAMGFNMTVEEPVFDFEKIEFCQTKPVFNGEEYIMCRNPHTALAKDSVFLQPFQTTKQVGEWMDAVGQGGLSLTGGLPVFQEFYQMMCRNGTKGGKDHRVFSWGVRHLIGNLSHKYREILPETRASFYLAFGTTPDAQIEMEKRFAALSIDVGKFDQLTYQHDFCLQA
jgi:hypothetical protein